MQLIEAVHDAGYVKVLRTANAESAGVSHASGRASPDSNCPPVIVQEGGYRLDRSGEHALVFLRPFEGRYPGL